MGGEMDKSWVKPVTYKEKKLINYLGNCIADYIEEQETCRTELMAALSHQILILFKTQTPLTNYHDKITEIEAFCEFLKIQIGEP
jgi:hypothetical protein